MGILAVLLLECSLWNGVSVRVVMDCGLPLYMDTVFKVYKDSL